MDKQKQIEEMEKDIAVRMAMAKGIAGSMNKGVEGWLGEYLIENGWIKPTENAVVLTGEEYDELQKGVKTYNYTAMFDAQSAYRWEQGYLQCRKEMAEKFAETRMVKDIVLGSKRKGTIMQFYKCTNCYGISIARDYGYFNCCPYCGLKIKWHINGEEVEDGNT